MSKETKIEWADSTVNFWSGCTKVSAGCKNCYAEVLSNRKLGNIGEWGKGAARKRHQSAFNLALRLNRVPWVCDVCGAATGVKPWKCCDEAEGFPTIHFHRRRVFSLSLGDWLDPEVPIEWLAEMLDTIRRCDNLDWLLVTKRPELFSERVEYVIASISKISPLHGWLLAWWNENQIPPHIMVLTSAENQQAADERIRALLAIPAARRGLSCEPLLSEIKFSWTFGHIDWVIVGGESGSCARPCNVEWIRDIKNQCTLVRVPCFVKQLGTAAVKPDADHDFAPFPSTKKGGDMAEWPEDLRVREFPKV